MSRILYILTTPVAALALVVVLGAHYYIIWPVQLWRGNRARVKFNKQYDRRRRS